MGGTAEDVECVLVSTSLNSGSELHKRAYVINFYYDTIGSQPGQGISLDCRLQTELERLMVELISPDLRAAYCDYGVEINTYPSKHWSGNPVWAIKVEECKKWHVNPGKAPYAT